VWSNGSVDPEKINSSIPIDSFTLFVSVTGDIYIYNDYNDSSDNNDSNDHSSSEKIALNKNSADQDHTDQQRKQRWPPGKKKPCRKPKKKHFCGSNNGNGQTVDHSGNGGGSSGNKSATGGNNGGSQNSITVNHGQVYKLSSNLNNGTIVMSVNGSCVSIFVIDSTIYCSMDDHHQVVKNTLPSDINTLEIVAGNGSSGSTSTMLNEPQGIFVDTDFNVYVADFGNNRIQRFRLNESYGQTVAGNESNENMKLWGPTGVALDADGSLFIVDSGNYRIVKFGPNGFRCIVGCSISSGSASDELSRPWSLSFDSYGNIFVSDLGNNRIQKFDLETNACSKSRLLIIDAVLNNPMPFEKVYRNISTHCAQSININEKYKNTLLIVHLYIIFWRYFNTCSKY
jgi:hypothetical protein